MSRFTRKQLIHHRLIKSKWKIWLFPAICMAPYTLSVLWLISLGQIWIAQVLLTPLLMMVVLAIVTLILAQAEFRLISRRRR